MSLGFLVIWLSACLIVPFGLAWFAVQNQEDDDK